MNRPMRPGHRRALATDPRAWSLFSGDVAGAFEKCACVEDGSGADQGDQTRRVDGSSAALSGFDPYRTSAPTPVLDQASRIFPWDGVPSTSRETGSALEDFGPLSISMLVRRGPCRTSALSRRGASSPVPWEISPAPPESRPHLLAPLSTGLRLGCHGKISPVQRAVRAIGVSDGTRSAMCGATAACAGILSMFAAQNGHIRVTALVGIATTDPIAALARKDNPGFQLVNPPQHYDGTYYYAIARDPLLLGRAHTLIDQAAYRYGHPLHGWVAGVLSFGHARAVPLALMLLSLLGLGGAGWAFSRLALTYGKSAWIGLVPAFSPGLLYAATVDTTETLGAALIGLSFVSWLRGRLIVATLLLVLTCLDKEQYIAVPLGLLVWEVSRFAIRGEHEKRWAVKLVAISAGPVALSAWYLYVHSRLHTWPWSYEPGNLGAPFLGWRDSLELAFKEANGNFEQSEIGTLAPPVLVATALIILFGSVVALRLCAIFDATLIGLAAVSSLQGWKTLVFPHELFRTSAVAVLLGVAVLLTRPPPRR